MIYADAMTIPTRGGDLDVRSAGGGDHKN